MKGVIFTAICFLLICAVSVGAWNVVNNTENVPPTLLKLIEEISNINYDFKLTYEGWLEMQKGLEYLNQLEENVFYSEDVSFRDLWDYITVGNPIVRVLYALGYAVVLLVTALTDTVTIVVQIFGIILHLFFGYAPNAA